VQLFAILNHLRENLDPVPPLPHLAELNLPIALADGVVVPSLEEFVDQDADEDAGQPRSGLSISYVKSVQDTIEIEEDSRYSEPVINETAASTRKPSSSSALAKMKDQRIIDAESWAAGYRATTSKVKAPPSSLRAYKIWHMNDDLTPQGIAKLLRDPPLQTNTVVSYILEAIRLEKLPYAASRLRTEVLDLLPTEVKQYRYQALLRATNDVGE
jgi:exonuclease 3'-5' domain-containing protein 2